jgi:hypothetical protein
VALKVPLVKEDTTMEELKQEMIEEIEMMNAILVHVPSRDQI